MLERTHGLRDLVARGGDFMGYGDGVPKDFFQQSDVKGVDGGEIHQILYGCEFHRSPGD
jgi:hypothetical protein